MSQKNSMSCTAEDGKGGCECVTETEEGCELETSCTSGSKLTHYDHALHEMFTESEILIREATHAAITEPALRQALRADGFPLTPQ